MFTNKTVLITGGTGSWGNELVRQILANHDSSEIRIYSRGEARQIEMRRHFNNSHLRFIIGDVRDKEKLNKSLKGVDIVFHLAALKHIPVCEEDPWEAIQTNIYGTQNLIEGAIQNEISKVIYVSTDKAVDPLNLYGITKACSEKLMISANVLSPQTTFTCIRAGNVIGTSGSVIPLFRHQILKNNVVTITHKQMTRFFMRLKDAIGFLFSAAEKAIGGEISVMRMPVIRIMDLATLMVQKLGNKDTEIEFIGIRPGEKIHEVLVSKNESSRTIDFGDYFVILPLIYIPKVMEAYGDMEKISLEEYSSQNVDFLAEEQIQAILAEEGWLGIAESAIVDFLGALSKEEVHRIIESGGWL